MARPEIPSIVVHNGSASAPGSPNMELPSRTLRPTRSLCKQTSLVDEEDVEEGTREGGDFSPLSPSASSPHPPSLPVTPPSPSPAVSPSSPPVSTPASTPGHLRSSTPSSTASSTNLASPSGTSLPQGPGPGGGSFDGGTMAVGHGGPAGPSCLSSGAASRSKSLELPHQRSSDSEKDAPPNTSARHRHYHGSKLKLLQRSHAMQEDTSPPPDIIDPVGPMQMPHGQVSNSLTVCQPPMGCPGGPPRRRLRHQGSSQGSYDGSSPCLSRDSSTEYTDSTGVDLLQFIIQTLHKNQKDRMLLLKIERELVNIVKDPKRTYHKFPHMSSYQRMLVHRVAAYFGMEHNVDQVGTCVIVNKTRSTRLPETRFREHIRDELLPSDEPKRSILRRGFSSFEEGTNYKSPDRLHGIESRRSKSFEEREEEYEKVRRRIFSEESFSMDGMGDSPRRFHDPFLHNSRRNSHEDSRWQDCRHFVDPESHRKHYDNHRIRPNRLAKGESFESHDSLHPRSLRPPVFKSHSFGGYSGGVTVLSRGDSVASNPSSRLSKQDSTGSRFSDHSSSSGYKTQRQDTSSTNVSNTLSTTPSPTGGQHQHPSFGQIGGMWGSEGESQPVMWAVTDMEAVPSGALLINPQSGQPYTNADGSVYRYDPANPPPIIKTGASTLQKMSSFPSKDREDKRLQGATETVTPTTTGAPSSLSPGGSSGSGAPNPQGSACPPVTCSSPAKGSHQVSSSETLQDIKGDPGDIDEGIEGISCSSSSSKGHEGRDPGKHLVRGSEDEASVSSHSQFFHPAHVEGRSYSQENISEVGSHLRQLSLSGSGNVSEGPDVSPVSVGTPIPPQGYVMPRQQYQPTVYYMPATSFQNLSGGGMKYVYPQYQVAPVQGTGNVQQTSLTGANMQTHPPPIPALSNMAALPTIPQPIAGPGPPQPPNPVQDANAHLPPGYIPNNYAVVAYPPNGLLSTVTSTGGGHESGGTTYYCQIAGPAAIAPAAAAGTATTPGGATAPAVSLQQYAPSSSTTTTFPMAMGYYTGSGVSNNGMYQAHGMQGFPGGVYGGPQSHAGVTPQPPHQAALSYRASTPPHTPSTQGVTMPLGFNSAGAAGVPPPPPPPPAGVGGQYIVLPPPQPPTPTSHASQLFSTFFRPSVQMMSGSTGTPPPQSVLQYGGVSAPLPTPHPPVFAKPYVGSSMHPLIPGGSGEPQCSGSGAGKEESKRYVGSVGALPQSGGPVPHVAPLAGTPTAHLLPRPYTFMQNSLAGSGAGTFRAPTPILISGPRPRHFIPSPAGALTPLTLARPPKFKRQKSRLSYSRSSDSSTSHSIEGADATEKL